MTDWSSTHEYLDSEFEIECPKCNKINIVKIYKQDGHNELEETWCANCHQLLGKFRASNTPRTILKIDEK